MDFFKGSGFGRPRKNELKGFEGLDGIVGFLEENGEIGLCCCLRLALTSEKWEENENWDWMKWRMGIDQW